MEKTAARSALRRSPKQERSRERIDAILSAAMQLIGEKGIDAVKMREVATLAGGPIATVYQYFPNKSAILATLYERFSETNHERLSLILAGVKGFDDVIGAASRLLDDYYDRLAADPAIQDLNNAIQADKALKDLDIVETRRLAAMFCERTETLAPQSQRAQFRRTVFLLFQLAGSVVRLALSQQEPERSRLIEDYKSIIDAQLKAFAG